MHHRVGGLFAACAAVVVLSVCASAASATSLAFGATGLRLIFPEFTASGTGFTVRCPMTLEGSFHARTVSKTVGSLIGYISRVQIGTCSGGRINPLVTPWHITYSSFTGALPNLEGIEVHIVEAGFLVEISGISCLYRTTSVSAGRVVAELLREKVSTVRWSEGRLPLLIGSGLCPGEASFGGGGRSSVLEGTEPIDIRLAF